MSIIIFFIILLVLVLVHEFGHFFTAKSFGIRVDEFGFGFPPKLFGVKKGETEYTFNLLPIGGFVRIFGENPDEENINGPDAGRSFVNKPAWQQAVVLFAGVFMNFLLAWFLFSIGFMSGLPTSVGSEPSGSKLSDVHLTIISVAPKSPAEIAGLKSGDKIISVGNNDFTLTPDPDIVKTFVTTSMGKPIHMIYTRGKDSTPNAINVTPTASTPGGTLTIGISMDMIGTAKLGFFSALKEGASLTWFVIKGTVLGLYRLIADSLHGKGNFSSVTGPVGLVGIAGDAYKFGFAYLLSFAALISVNLGVINLFPFPALDGGRLFFLLIEKIKGSRLNPKIVNMANTIGFGILIFLMLIITYHDVVKLF